MPTELKTKSDNGNATLTACKEAMLADLKNAVADASDLLKDTADSGVEEFTAVHSKLETRLGEARAAATENTRGAAQASDGYVREHPWTMLGIVAATGFIVGAFFRRFEDLKKD